MKTFSSADVQVVAALVRMNAPEMKPLLSFFENLLEESKDALIRADGPMFSRLQGRAGTLQEFVEAVKNSPSALEKLQKQR